MQSAIPKPSFSGLETSPASSPPPVYNNKDPASAISSSAAGGKKKRRKHQRDADGWYIPQLGFNAEDLGCAGCEKFFAAVPDVPALLRDAVSGVVRKLYETPEAQPVYQTSITLFLRSMQGVAYTAGKKEKQIHFSTDYIDGVDEDRMRDELLGVVRHEMVHAWQYNARNTAPPGLIEGIADWIRLKDGLIPPHWKRGGMCWDDGYQTTAYFLEWLCDTYGEGTVRWINEQMKDKVYDEAMWAELSGGKSVGELWLVYTAHYGIGHGPKKGRGGKGKETDEKNEIEGCEKNQIARTVEMHIMSDDKSTTVLEVPIYNAAPPPSPHPERTMVIVDQEAVTTGDGGSVQSLADTDGSESSFDPFPFHAETSMSEVFAYRLKKLTFDGSRDGKRFLKEFEGLCQRVNPAMSGDDKRLLLTTCFVGDAINNWYEEVDLDDDLSYLQLAGLLQQRWKGKSMREVAVIDRDLKLS